jgi:hypothetical protein
MEITCWRCYAVFDPEALGSRCPNCGHHPEAWMAKLRFAGIDFIGPAILLSVALFDFRNDVMFSVLFVIVSLVWVGFICYEDVDDWAPAPDVPLTKPPMPESWKQQASVSPPLDSESTSLSQPHRARRLTWAEMLLIAALLCGLTYYSVSHWSRFADSVVHRKGTILPVYLVVILGFIVYGVRRGRFEEEVLQDGVLTTGVLAGWYDKSSYIRTGYQQYIRIRYHFWTEAGQKFEGSGTLNPGSPFGNLSLNLEPLKVYYLPQDPSKNVALCCTTTREKFNG